MFLSGFACMIESVLCELVIFEAGNQSDIFLHIGDIKKIEVLLSCDSTFLLLTLVFKALINAAVHSLTFVRVVQTISGH